MSTFVQNSILKRTWSNGEKNWRNGVLESWSIGELEYWRKKLENWGD